MIPQLMHMVTRVLHGMIAMNLQDHMAAAVAMMMMTLVQQHNVVHVKILIVETVTTVILQERIKTNLMKLKNIYRAVQRAG